LGPLDENIYKEEKICLVRQKSYQAVAHINTLLFLLLLAGVPLLTRVAFFFTFLSFSSLSLVERTDICVDYCPKYCVIK
jgi:hypothetical protein